MSFSNSSVTRASTELRSTDVRLMERAYQCVSTMNEVGETRVADARQETAGTDGGTVQGNAVGVPSSQKQFREDYLNFARAFPELVHTSGALQAVTFLRKSAREKKAADRFLSHLQTMLGEASLDVQTWEQVASLPFSQYLRFTRHLMRSAEWLKRYSEILLASSSTRANEVKTQSALHVTAGEESQ